MTVVGELLMLLGALLVFVAGIGVHRFFDSLARLHAAGKASSLGMVLLLAGAALRSAHVGIRFEFLLTGILLLVAVPLATHVLVRSIYRQRQDRGRSPADASRS